MRPVRGDVMAGASLPSIGAGQAVPERVQTSQPAHTATVVEGVTASTWSAKEPPTQSSDLWPWTLTLKSGIFDGEPLVQDATRVVIRVRIPVLAWIGEGKKMTRSWALLRFFGLILALALFGVLVMIVSLFG